MSFHNALQSRLASRTPHRQTGGVGEVRGVLGALAFVTLFGAQTVVTKEAKDTDEVLKKRKEMVEMSRQLGVTCAYCHNVRDFKEAKMATHKVAKLHMSFVEDMNRKYKKRLGFSFDCYLCHRGLAKPRYQEPAVTAWLFQSL